MLQRPGGRIVPAGHDHRLDGLAPERVRHADHAAFRHGGMLHQNVLHLTGPHPVAAGLDDVVKAAPEPPAAVFVHAGRVPRMIHAVPPHMAVLLFVIQIRHEYPGLPARLLRDNDHLPGFIHGGGFPLPVAQFDVIEGRRHPHGTFHRRHAPEVGQQQGRFRLAVAFAQLQPRALRKLPEHFRRQHFPGCGRVFQRRHVGNSLPHQVPVNRRRCAEGGDSVPVDNLCQLLRVKAVKVIDHHGAAHQPLAVDLPPGSLRPSGFRHGEVEAVVLRLLPVFRRDDVGQRIAVCVNDPFRVAGGAGGEIQDHGIRGFRLHPGEVLPGVPHVSCNIFEALRLSLHAPEPRGDPCLLYCLRHLLRHPAPGGADHGLCPGGLQPVHQVADRQHMRHGDHHGTQLVQGHCREPVFVVALQDQHHPVPGADAPGPEHIGHPVAVPPDIREGENVFLPFGVAPHQRPLVRGFLRDPVCHVIAEVEIVRIIQGDFCQGPVFIGNLMAVFQVYAHMDSFTTAPAPIERNLSYRFPTRSASFANASVSSFSRLRIRS